MFKFNAWWAGLSPQQAATGMLHPASESAGPATPPTAGERAHEEGQGMAGRASRQVSQETARPVALSVAHQLADHVADHVAHQVADPLTDRPRRQADDATAISSMPQGPRSAAVGAAPLDLSELVGAEGWARLPAAVRRRFAAGHAATVYEGRMDLACSRIGRAYALLARLFGSPLTAARSTALPTRVRVHNDCQGGVVWERCFAARDGMPAQTVRSTKLRERDGGGLVERTDGGLAMHLDVLEERGVLVFQSRDYFFDLFGWKLPVPAWLTPGTCRVEHHDLGPGRFRFTLVMDHARWGRCFEQTGDFMDPDGSVE